MSNVYDFKYKDLKYKKEKRTITCSCKYCDYFSGGVCQLDGTYTNEYRHTCNCFTQDKFNVGDKVQVPWMGKIHDTEIVEITKIDNKVAYLTTIANDQHIKNPFLPRDIKKIKY